MKRLFDLVLAFILIVILAIPMLIIVIAVRLSSKGPVIYYSFRIGHNNTTFKMPKFRSMLVNTPELATHLMTSDLYLSPIGGFIRRYSLDELPQLFLIIKGDMSFVGPRPALFNQDDLIKLRTTYKVDTLIPGLTGWAQVNGRDDLSIAQKTMLDVQYMKKQSFLFDLKILWITFFKVIKSDGVSG